MSTEFVQILVAVIAGLALFVTKLVETRQGRRNERAELAADVALLKELPPESTARDTLRANIDARIEAMTSSDDRTRHWFGIVMSCIFLVLGAWLGYAAWAAWPSWWWAIPLGVIAFICLIIFIAGLATGVPKRKRGPNGSIIQEPTAD
ncbi:hypothetical protein [Curtobacterium sp. MCBA15_012]|uniref:hypothetical protein n=1 Tax=Curtobacterium sp. MCBA15_012 TaxID=1898738 RepID=UPI0011138EEC|nr:hypothetical protein [Curtobacterium sp. MCBA15_012]WIA99728.1 hypothetical protein QOL15_14635 [Curtobacterium sp. MCBA15_012]